MFKKAKRYLLLIPLLFVMLLNLICYGQFFAFADSSVHFERFHSLDEISMIDYDFTDDEAINSYIYQQTDYSGVTYDYFYHDVFMNAAEYTKFLSGESFEVRIVSFFVNNFNNLVEDENFYHFTNIPLFSNVVLKYSPDSDTYTLSHGSEKFYDQFFIYYKNTGSYFYAYSNVSSDTYKGVENIYRNYNEIHFYQSSNIPDFPFFYDYEAAASVLDVDVVFSPELTGAFNRTVSDRGQTVTLDDFSFNISNHSNFDIQYIMAIYRESDTFLPFNSDPLAAQSDTTFTGKTYVGSPVYVYVKDEWLYLPHRQNGVITGYAPSSWHMVSAGDSDFVTINFNQVKLNTFQNYNVVVYAIRNDLSYATPFTNLNEFQVPACADYNVDIENLSLVYSSQFSILNPAEFDATNNDNSYAFDEDDRLLFNRANGYIDENGEMVIDRVDTNQWVTEGSDDPWVNWDSDLNAWDTYYRNQNTVSSDIDQLSRNFSSFFKFVNKVFSYFPKNYQSIIILGLTSMVVLGLFRVLI